MENKKLKTKCEIKQKIEELIHQERLLEIDLEEGNYTRGGLIGFKVN